MHLSDGELRRLVDEPSALPEDGRRHADECLACRARKAAILADAQWSAGLFAAAAAGPAADAPAALRQFEARPGASRGGRLAAWLSAPRAAGAALAAAALLALVVYGPVGSYASQLLTVFEPVQVAPLSVPTDLFGGLNRLVDYGDVTVPKTALEPASSASAAAALSGLSLALPGTLPAGLGTPTFEVLPASTAQFTFLAAKAEKTAAAAGVTLPAMPQALDHSSLSMTVGPAALALYPATTSAAGASGAAGGAASNLNGLFVAVVDAPVVRSNGADTATIENYLLSLPGIPSALASELRALENPSQTLPIPIPEGEATATDIQLGAQPAVAIADRSGLLNAVVWEAQGRIHAVAGPFTPAQIQAAAASVAAQG